MTRQVRELGCASRMDARVCGSSGAADCANAAVLALARACVAAVGTLLDVTTVGSSGQDEVNALSLYGSTLAAVGFTDSPTLNSQALHGTGEDDIAVVTFSVAPSSTTLCVRSRLGCRPLG